MNPVATISSGPRLEPKRPRWVVFKDGLVPTETFLDLVQLDPHRVVAGQGGEVEVLPDSVPHGLYILGVEPVAGHHHEALSVLIQDPDLEKLHQLRVELQVQGLNRFGAQGVDGDRPKAKVP